MGEVYDATRRRGERTVLDALPQPAVLVDRDGIVLHANPPACTSLGATLAALEGTALLDAVGEPVGATSVADVVAAVGAGRSGPGTSRHRPAAAREAPPPAPSRRCPPGR